MIVVLNGTPRSGKSPIARRREAGDERYASDRALVERRAFAVHAGWASDREVDPLVANPAECAAAVARRLADDTPPSAFSRLATFPR